MKLQHQFVLVAACAAMIACGDDTPGRDAAAGQDAVDGQDMAVDQPVSTPDTLIRQSAGDPVRRRLRLGVSPRTVDVHGENRIGTGLRASFQQLM